MIKDNPFHAVICLKSWVEQGEKMMSGVLIGPWYMDPDNGEESGPICAKDFDGEHYDAVVSRGPELYGGIKSYPTMKFMARSRSLVPGMLDGMKVLITKYKITAHEFGLDGIATRVLRRVILDVARTYEPRMVEAGFMVPDPE